MLGQPYILFFRHKSNSSKQFTFPNDILFLYSSESCNSYKTGAAALHAGQVGE